MLKYCSNILPKPPTPPSKELAIPGINITEEDIIETNWCLEKSKLSLSSWILFFANSWFLFCDEEGIILNPTIATG